MITVLGSLNMDLFIETPRFPAPGETVLGKAFRRACGGKGANQACAIARLGHPVAMIGAVGADPFGEEMVANLAGEGVDIGAVARLASSSSGVALILLDGAGQNQIVVSAGANEMVDAETVRAQRDLLARSEAVLAQFETPLPAVRAALQLGREHGRLTVFNPAPLLPADDDLLRLCDVIVMNEHEAAGLSGMEVAGRSGAAMAAQRIRDRSGANVVVTLGGDGAWLETREGSEHIPAFRVDAVDTVGAGDAFIGALAVRLCEKASFLEAASFACAAAGLSVTRHGAQSGLPRRDEVERWRAQRAGDH